VINIDESITRKHMHAYFFEVNMSRYTIGNGMPALAHGEDLKKSGLDNN
jgi:hypothetical protein